MGVSVPPLRPPSCRKTFWSLSMVTTVRCWVSWLTERVCGTGDGDAGLQHRRGEHEDEQQHQHHVDQRRDVDVGQRGLGADLAAAAGGEGHG